MKKSTVGGINSLLLKKIVFSGLVFFFSYAQVLAEEKEEKKDMPPAWKRARLLTIPGETSHLYVSPFGLSINPFINDLWGDTDKLLTGGNQIRYAMPTEGGSLEASVNWRFFVPAIEPKHGKKKLENPPGHYADWIAAGLSWSKAYQWAGQKVKIGLNLGLGHIGNHGAAKVHEFTHDLVSAKKDGLEYTNQPEGYKAEIGFELGWVPEWGKDLYGIDMLMISSGVYAYSVLYERWLAFNFIIGDESQPDYTLEARLINPYRSDTMPGDFKHFRYEVSFGIFINKYYTPTMVFVSPYMDRDIYPQLYINLIAFNLPSD